MISRRFEPVTPRRRRNSEPSRAELSDRPLIRNGEHIKRSTSYFKLRQQGVEKPCKKHFPLRLVFFPLFLIFFFFCFSPFFLKDARPLSRGRSVFKEGGKKMRAPRDGDPPMGGSPSVRAPGCKPSHAKMLVHGTKMTRRAACLGRICPFRGRLRAEQSHQRRAAQKRSTS